MTVARLERELSWTELVEWHIYYGRKAQREQLETQKARSRQ